MMIIIITIIIVIMIMIIIVIIIIIIIINLNISININTNIYSNMMIMLTVMICQAWQIAIKQKPLASKWWLPKGDFDGKNPLDDGGNHRFNGKNDGKPLDIIGF